MAANRPWVLCSQCDKTEEYCTCEKYCTICKARAMSASRIDGLYYCLNAAKPVMSRTRRSLAVSTLPHQISLLMDPDDRLVAAAVGGAAPLFCRRRRPRQ